MDVHRSKAVEDNQISGDDNPRRVFSRVTRLCLVGETGGRAGLAVGMGTHDQLMTGFYASHLSLGQWGLS